MFGEYFQHVLKNQVHNHFPDFERTTRTTIEEHDSFITVIREFNPLVRLTHQQIREMKTLFLAYLKRRSGSFKMSFSPCKGTIGRWGRRRSCRPTIELTYSCYDCIFYRNWIQSACLDRLVWSNVIPILITESHCPYGSKNGIIFIID